MYSAPMAGSRIITGKSKPKPKRRVITHVPALSGLKIKNECKSSRLADGYQERAATAYSEGKLDLLKVRCSCGAVVGAIKKGDSFAPTRHAKYKEPKRPALKPGLRK